MAIRSTGWKGSATNNAGSDEGEAGEKRASAFASRGQHFAVADLHPSAPELPHHASIKCPPGELQARHPLGRIELISLLICCQTLWRVMRTQLPRESFLFGVSLQRWEARYFELQRCWYVHRLSSSASSMVLSICWFTIPILIARTTGN